MQIATKARQAIWGLTPDEQRAKHRAELRKEMRSLDNSSRNIAQHEHKSFKHLRDTSNKLQKMGVNPAKDPAIRKLALGIVRARTQQKRLAASKAQMNSIFLQFNSTKSLEVMENSMKQATSIMKSTNTQIRLPELMAASRNLEQESMKAETYQEMVDDLLDPVDQSEDLETEDEVNEINQLLNGILKGQESKIASAPDIEMDEPIQVEEEDEAIHEQMLGRMQALRS